MMKLQIVSFLFLLGLNLTAEGREGPCTKSETTVIGSLTPQGQICSGDLIFEDNFDSFDIKKWQRQNTLSGGGNGEFQWYTTSENNSFVKNGIVHIRPTFVSDTYGNDFLYYGTIDLKDSCTESFSNGCKRTGNKEVILPPIQSGKLTTQNSFSFKYGKLEVRAKTPAGDWLWPAIWLLPKDFAYGGWPASGEIDLLESRGNKLAATWQGTNIGTQQVASTLHWGPNSSLNRFYLTHFEKNNNAGYDTGFHIYTLLWSSKSIKFLVDGVEIGNVTPPAGGFWELGNLSNSGVPNPWKTQMAPFDKEFYIILNLAVGGTTGFFPDDANYDSAGKPWKNGEANGVTKFWENRNTWDPTWHREDTNTPSHLEVDYLRVWAL